MTEPPRIQPQSAIQSSRATAPSVMVSQLSRVGMGTLALAAVVNLLVDLRLLVLPSTIINVLWAFGVLLTSPRLVWWAQWTEQTLLDWWRGLR